MEGEAKEKRFEIIGRKIQLHERRGKMKWNQIADGDLQPRFRILEMRHSDDADFDLEREMIPAEEYSLQMKNKPEFSSKGNLDEEKITVIGIVSSTLASFYFSKL